MTAYDEHIIGTYTALVLINRLELPDSQFDNEELLDIARNEVVKFLVQHQVYEGEKFDLEIIQKIYNGCFFETEFVQLLLELAIASYEKDCLSDKETRRAIQLTNEMFAVSMVLHDWLIILNLQRDKKILNMYANILFGYEEKGDMGS